MALLVWVHYRAFKLKVITGESKPEPYNFTKKSALGTHCSIILPNSLAFQFMTQETYLEGPIRRTYPTPSVTAQENNNDLDIRIAS
jgi:hypothetical protein